MEIFLSILVLTPIVLFVIWALRSRKSKKKNEEWSPHESRYEYQSPARVSSPRPQSSTDDGFLTGVVAGAIIADAVDSSYDSSSSCDSGGDFDSDFGGDF